MQCTKRAVALVIFYKAENHGIWVIRLAPDFFRNKFCFMSSSANLNHQLFLENAVFEFPRFGMIFQFRGNTSNFYSYQNLGI